MLLVSQSGSPLPQFVAPLRLPAAHAFGVSADAANLLLGLLTQLQSSQQLAGSCRACCTSVSGQTPTPQAALASPVAQLPTAACRHPCLGSSGHPGQLDQSTAAAQHALHCTPV